MKRVLLAVGTENLGGLLRAELSQYPHEDFDVLYDAIYQRRFIIPITEQTRPDYLIIHDTFLNSSVDGPVERDREMLQILKTFKLKEIDVRIVYICERAESDPFLGKLVGLGVYDIFHQQRFNSRKFIEQICDSKRYSNVANFGSDEMEVETEKPQASQQAELPEMDLTTLETSRKSIFKNFIDKVKKGDETVADVQPLGESSTVENEVIQPSVQADVSPVKSAVELPQAELPQAELPEMDLTTLTTPKKSIFKNLMGKVKKGKDIADVQPLGEPSTFENDAAQPSVLADVSPIKETEPTVTAAAHTEVHAPIIEPSPVAHVEPTTVNGPEQSPTPSLERNEPPLSVKVGRRGGKISSTGETIPSYEAQGNFFDMRSLHNRATVIACAGLVPNVGTTTLAVHIAKTLATMKKKVAVIELNQSLGFERLHSYVEQTFEMIHDSEQFTHQHITFIKYQVGIHVTDYLKDYDIVVLDLGQLSDHHPYIQEFKRAAKRYVCTPLSMWKWYTVDRLNRQDSYALEDYTFLLSGGEQMDCQMFQQTYGNDVEVMGLPQPTQLDIFTLTDTELLHYQQLLAVKGGAASRKAKSKGLPKLIAASLFLCVIGAATYFYF